MTISPAWKLPTLTGLLGILVGLGLGWKLYHPTVIVEAAKPEIHLPSGAIVLEKTPDIEPPAPIKQATKELGGKLVRAGTIIIQPKPSTDSSPGCSCDEFHLDYGLVNQDDGQRLVLHSDDAEIVGGNDIPLEPYTIPKEANWEVGVVVPIDNPEGVGPSVARRVGPFHLGAAAFKSKEGGWTGLVSATISF